MAEGADFETAIRLTEGNGCFNCAAMTICGCICATAALSATVVSFVLPAARCDLQLSSEYMGMLAAAPNFGMLLGHAVWGLVSDARGRKAMIASGLLLDALGAFASALPALPYWALLAARTLCGFGTAASTTLLFPYLGEMVSSAVRDRMLCTLEVCWAIAMAILPGVAWALGQQGPDGGPMAPWRLLLLVCAAPSLLSAVALCVCLPEAPKYLMSKGQGEKALRALQRIHRTNAPGRGSPATVYPVTSLQLQQEEGPKDLVAHVKALFWGPLLPVSAAALLLQGIVMSSYYTLVLWLPELLDRYERFQTLFPGQEARICDAVSMTTTDLEDSTPATCDDGVNSAVYLRALYAGATCVLAATALVVIVDRVDKRKLLAVTMLTSGTCMISINFVQTAVGLVALACAFEGIASASISLLICLAVQIMPTAHRAFAMASQHVVGRAGAILGNLVFGWLVDERCDVPFALGGVLLLGGTLLISLIPKNEPTKK